MSCGGAACGHSTRSSLGYRAQLTVHAQSAMNSGPPEGGAGTPKLATSRCCFGNNECPNRLAGAVTLRSRPARGCGASPFWGSCWSSRSALRCRAARPFRTPRLQSSAASAADLRSMPATACRGRRRGTRAGRLTRESHFGVALADGTPDASKAHRCGASGRTSMAAEHFGAARPEGDPTLAKYYGAKRVEGTGRKQSTSVLREQKDPDAGRAPTCSASRRVQTPAEHLGAK